MDRFIEKTFNIAPHELMRTLYSWLLRFLIRVGFVIGWTTITALFVTQFSINALPFLFMIQAVLTILGMVIFSLISERLSSKVLAILCAAAASSILLIASFLTSHLYVYFGLLLIVSGLLMPQLFIFISNYIEDFFSPLECERTFPVIESAETIAGIFAGVLLMSFAKYIASYKFFYLWILFLFMFVNVLYFLQPVIKGHFQEAASSPHYTYHLKTRIKKIRFHLHEIRFFPFLYGLLFLIVLHWVAAQFIEFQYTKMVASGVSHAANSSPFEEQLTHGLGSFHIFFYACALVVQLLVASRILRKLGTVGGFLFHALITFFSSMSIFIGLTPFSAVLAKNNFEISGVVHKNSYEASYYAFPHGSRRMFREFFEGFISPVGTIIGTLIILGIEFFFIEEHRSLILQVGIILIAMLMIVFSIQLQKGYTDLSIENLLQKDNKLSKLHAVEILSQKGHVRNLDILLAALHKEKKHPEVQEKIIESFGRLKDFRAIHELLPYLYNSNNILVLATVKALGNYSFFTKNVFDQAFSRYQVIQKLKELFVKSEDDHIRIAIVQALAHLQYYEIVPFILDTLEKASPSLQTACIKVCGLFHDPTVSSFIERYLTNDHSHVRAQAIAALWQFEPYRKKLLYYINKMLGSDQVDDLQAICMCVADINERSLIKRLIPFLTDHHLELRLTAAFSLIRLGYKSASSYLAHLLLRRNSVLLAKAKVLFSELNDEQKHLMHNSIQKALSQKLHHLQLKGSTYASHLEVLDIEQLENYGNAFSAIGSYQEAEFIEELIQKRKDYAVSNEATLTITPAQLVPAVQPAIK